MKNKGHTQTVRGNKKGVKGTAGAKRGKRQIAKSQGIAMKPRGKGGFGTDGGRGKRIARMEQKDMAV